MDDLCMRFGIANPAATNPQPANGATEEAATGASSVTTPMATFVFPSGSTPALDMTPSTGTSDSSGTFACGEFTQMGYMGNEESNISGNTPTPSTLSRMSTPSDFSRVHARSDDDITYEQSRGRVPGHLIRAIAQEKAQKHGLTAEQVADVLSYSELSAMDMLIDLKIHLFKNENELLRRYLKIFVRHPDFATRLKAFVAAALLAPIAPAYLDQVYTSLALYLEKNIEGLVGLSPACRRDPADWMLVKSALADVLSAERSAMKRKIELAIQNKQDIYVFTQNMMTHDIRPKQGHWGRFAFLRHCTVLYKSSRTKTAYWKFIDEKLKEVRLATKAESPNNDTGRKLSETNFFARILNADITNFPITSGAVARQTYTNEGLTELQVSIEGVIRGIVLDDDVVRPDDAPERQEEQL